MVLTQPPDHDTPGLEHFHLGIALNLDNPEAPVVWDCTAGLTAAQAVNSWVATTAATVLELLDQRGEFAGHLGPDDPAGFSGWHAIHGRIAGWGDVEFQRELMEWWAEQSVLPALRHSLDGELDRPFVNGIKLVVGQFERSTFEVSVNSRFCEDATAELASLDWPQPSSSQKGALAKTFVLLVHPEESA